MRALLIGGTGIISTDITKLCVEQGWDITLINRGNRSEKLPADIKLTTWQLDINDEAAVKAKLDGERFDVVANFINFNVQQVERDIKLFAGKTNQYIFISSASAYQKPRANYVITESTLLVNPYWEYSRNKIACEERLVDEHRKNGFPVTIIRPSHTYDDYTVPLGLHGANGAWSTLKRILDGKPVIIPGDGNSLWHLTHSSDFAQAFVGIMGNIHAIGEAIHITGDEAITWNQIYAILGDILGVVPKIVHVPTDFLVACKPDLDGPLNGDKSVNTVFDNSKIKGLVPHFTAKTRFDTGARAAVAHFLANKEKQQPDPEFEKFTDAIIEAQQAAVAQVKSKLG
ncbi:MAG: SDR family oxidoreductase [Defluviitaleaceae bacterium]|nr:SDR family oxidoreductase [Defluviitaleaceae bacterium]